LLATPQTLRRYFGTQPQKESLMGSTADKVKGVANKTIGKVKQGVGEATDDEALKNEGRLQEVKGEVQHNVGKAKDIIKKAGDL
jgi:uncharacterized protein YjbJ (UPF0337 family)